MAGLTGSGAGPERGGVFALEFSGVPVEQQVVNVLPGPATTVVDPLAGYLGDDPTIARWAERVRATVRSSARVVIGNCSAAFLAAALVARGGPVRDLVLFDPQRVDDQTVRAEFAIRHESLGGEPAPALSATAGRTGRALVAGLEAALRGVRAGLVEDLGGEDAGEAVDYLIGRHVAWLRYLARCSEAVPVVVPGRVHIVMSDGGCEPDAVLAGSAGVVTHRVAVPSDALLDSDETRTAVADALRVLT